MYRKVQTHITTDLLARTIIMPPKIIVNNIKLLPVILTVLSVLNFLENFVY